MARPSSPERRSDWGRVTIRRLRDARRTTSEVEGGLIVERSRYTWWPRARISGVLPEGFRIAMDCLAGRDGVRQFAPTQGVEPFLFEASLGGLAILSSRRGLDAEVRFSYHAMRMLFKLAPLLREHFGRSFKRESDLYIPGAERAGKGGKDILPDRIGLDREGRGRRWTVSELLRRGRDHAEKAGDPNPDPARCIAAGLLVAARLDPLDPACLSEAQALGLVRMALFDAGPAPRIDGATKQAVTERLLAALERHIGDDTEAFNRWFFEEWDGLVHQIAKQKKRGGPIAREHVRQAILDLIFDAYTYTGDCVCLQMQAFLQALPSPLGAEERARFVTLYFKQAHLGGLPLLLLRDRFDFLREAVLTVMDAPSEPAPIGALLRLLQYYEEMASRRRDVDRGYKRRGHHRAADGRIALTVPLTSGLLDTHTEPPPDRFQEIVARLRQGRGVTCACAAGEAWEAKLLDGGEQNEALVIVTQCERCGHSEQFEVERQEFERTGWELMRT